MVARAELVIDAGTVHPVGLGETDVKHFGQVSQRDVRGLRVPVRSLAHGVVYGGAAVAGEAERDRGADAVDARTLDDEREIEIHDVVADDEITPRVEIFEEPPEAMKGAPLVEVEYLRLATAAKHPAPLRAVVGFDDNSDCEDAPVLGVKGQ